MPDSSSRKPQHDTKTVVTRADGSSCQHRMEKTYILDAIYLVDGAARRFRVSPHDKDLVRVVPLSPSTNA